MVLLSLASVNLCACLCVCPVRAVPFESLELETSFLVRRYIFRISRPSSYVKVIESRSRSHEPKNGIYERSRVVRLRLEGQLVHLSFITDAIACTPELLFLRCSAILALMLCSLLYNIATARVIFVRKITIVKP